MSTFHHPYDYATGFEKRVAYFSMEFGIDQALKTFSGGLGYLAGSHMRSAYDLRQNLLGVGILWKYGYYDQTRRQDHSMEVLFAERIYNFLDDPEIKFTISVDNHLVLVKALYLRPEVFGTAPMYFLTTDLPENDHLAQTISHRLYDSENSAKVAQYILLGRGGSKLLEAINYCPDRIHLNEAHALPAMFYEYEKLNDLDALKKKFVFTTHTPVEAGNESHDILFLKKMGFFGELTTEKVKRICQIEEENLSLTLSALRLSDKANGVSKLHGEVARRMWSGYKKICEIDHITNAQHAGYWTDPTIKSAAENGKLEYMTSRKKEMKRILFAEVADQTGKIFDENVLTIVWARRFAPYKRADLLTRDMSMFERLLNDRDMPVQIIWAGKPYPMDYNAISIFNKLVALSKNYSQIAVLVKYELALSKLLKQGADIWLNTPRVTREASGTSGMTAAMNGAINLSTEDGWMPEFGRHGENSFLIPKISAQLPLEDQDDHDMNATYTILNKEIKPLYYNEVEKWQKIMQNSMRQVTPFFDSGRMASEYYQKLY